MAPTQTLPSWNDTATKRAIIDFVTAVATEGSPDYIAPAERIAVFDNDGTLWPEKPLVIQLDFTIGRLGELATADPSLREQQPYKAAYEKDFSWLNQAMIKHYQGDDSDLGLLMKAVPHAFEDMSIEAFLEEVRQFFQTATHPTLKRPYAGVGYQPMVELLRYLEANGFTVYIASGGDRDFMRGIAAEIYGIPPERIVGSSLKLEYKEMEDSVDVLYKSQMEFFDDGPEKPVRIWSRIGRRPVLAGGNSNGDIAMMRFANVHGRKALRLLVHHDDADRESAYDAGAEEALARAAKQDWTVISMKNDWNRVFAD
jgi:phosphoglycolate phosphatase-like HAD superfamily hydrolase